MAYRKTNIRQRITSIILAAAMLGTSPGHAFAESEDSFAVTESTESGMLSASSDSMTEAYLPTFEDVSDASGSDASDIQEASALPAEEAASPQNTTSEPAGSTDYSGSGEAGQTVSVSDTGAQADPVLPADDSGAAALPGMEEDTVQDEADPIEYEDEEVLVEKTLELQMTPQRLYEHDNVPTSELDTANQLWQWLYGRDPKPDPNPSPAAINVKIKGNLPEDVTAQAGYILFDDKKDEEGNDYPETAIASVDVSFVRSDGSEYIPVSDLKVTVSGQAVEEVISGADPYFLVYAHDEYNAMEALIVDESTFTSDVTVFRELPENDLDAQNEYWSKHADRLAYVTNQTHEPVTFIEDAEGLKLKKKKKKITFTFNEGTPLRFIVSAQTPEADIAVEDIPVEIEGDETEGLPVVEIPETEGIPVTETENVIIQETETTAVQETEALPAEIEELPVVEIEETEAAAVQETEAAIKEESEAAPVPETEIQTEFVEETEAEQIEIPAASETESEIKVEAEPEEETETEIQTVVETETESAEETESEIQAVVESEMETTTETEESLETETEEDVLVSRSLKVRSDDGSTLVSVSGMLPKDVTADATSEDAEAYSADLDGEGLLALDITLSRGEDYVSDTVASAEMSGDDAAAEADAEAADRTDSYQTEASQEDISDADVSEDVNGFAEYGSYQPEEPVRVVLTDPTIGEAVKNASELEVWHIADDGTSTKVENVRFVGNSAVFYADGFSVYVVVQTVKERILEASDGNRYKVTVEYDSTCGIPEDVELVVSELLEGTEEYVAYVEKTAEALQLEVDQLAFAHAFDIKLVNPETGEHYQPNKNVRVSVELLTEELEADDDVTVVHFTENIDRQSTVESGSYAGNPAESAEVIDSAVNEDGVVKFESGSFSTYVVVRIVYESTEETGWIKVSSLSELEQLTSPGSDTALYVSNIHYTMKNGTPVNNYYYWKNNITTNAKGNGSNRHGIERTGALDYPDESEGAARYYFSRRTDGKYIIYCNDSNYVQQYLRNESNHIKFTNVENNCTPFTIRCESDSIFTIKNDNSGFFINFTSDIGGKGFAAYDGLDGGNANNDGSKLHIWYYKLGNELNDYVGSTTYRTGIGSGDYSNVTSTSETNPAIVDADKTVTVQLNFSGVPIDMIRGNSQLFYGLPGNNDLAFSEGYSGGPVTVTIGGTEYILTASKDTDDPGKLKLTYSDALNAAKNSFTDTTTVNDFTIEVPLVITNTAIDDGVIGVEFGSDVTLYADTNHNPKIVSKTAGAYNAATGTISYTVIVTADGNVDNNGTEYPVVVNDVMGEALSFGNGSFTYAHGSNYSSEKTDTVISWGEDNSNTGVGTNIEFTGFPVTVAHMYGGDTLTLTYTANVDPDSIATSGESPSDPTEVGNQVSLTNNNDPDNPVAYDQSEIVMPEGNVTFSNITARSEVSGSGIDEDGKPYQDLKWTISANSARYANLLGTISSTLDTNSMSMSFVGSGITAVAKDAEGTTRYNQTIPWSNLTTTTDEWEWTLPDALKQKYDLTITYTTRFDLSGVTEDTNVTNAIESHMGNASFQGTVKPGDPFITKKHVSEEELETGSKHTFEVVVGGVTNESLNNGKLVVSDKLDETYASLWKLSSDPEVSVPGADDMAASVEATCTDGTITFNITPARDVNNKIYSFYKLTYSIEPNDLAGLCTAALAPDNLSVDENGNTVGTQSFTNTASVTSGSTHAGLKGQTTYSFSYSPISKSLDEVDGYWACYTVEINPDSLTLNDYNPLTLADDLSNNQEIEVSSIKAVDASGIDINGVTYNSATGKFTIPDGTHILLSFRARLMGAEGEKITISNTATLEERNISAAVNDTATIPGESQDEEDNLVCTYVFVDGDEQIHVQTVASIDELIIPQPAPSEDGKEFAGWYDEEEKLYDFENAELEEGVETVYLHSVYKYYAYVYFHDQYDAGIKDYPVAHTRRVELTQNGDLWTGKVKISDLSVTYRSANQEIRVFRGWSREPVRQPGEGKNKIITDTEDGWVDITLDERDFYPIFLDAYRLVYVSGEAGSGASYVPAASYCEDEGPTSQEIPVSQRDNYTFEGWWTTQDYQAGTRVYDNADGLTQDFDRDGVRVVTTGLGSYRLTLTDNATLYAKWSDEQAIPWKIIIWKQKTTDAADATNKTYDFVTSIEKTAALGTTVSVDDKYKTVDGLAGENITGIDAESFVYAGCDDPVVVNKDGYTVLNVYYDRKAGAADPSPSTEGYCLNFVDTLEPMEGVDWTGNSLPIRYDGSGGRNKVQYNSALAGYVPDDPEPAIKGYSGQEVFAFDGWYADAICSTRVFFDQESYDEYPYSKVLYENMPCEDLTIYAGWSAVWYLVKVDPNYGAFNGTGGTWFWETFDGEQVREYTQVTRDYVKSSSGQTYYAKRDRAYYGYSGNEWDNSEPDRDAYYTQDLDRATEDTTFEYSPGTYTYAGWYEVNSDGTETPYDFSRHVDKDLMIRLHWKKAGVYYLEYDAGNGLLDNGEQKERVEESYSDCASITLTRTASIADGSTFVGWRVKDSDDSIIYKPGTVFTVNSDDAVRVGGKDVITLVAVYKSAAEKTSITYDVNGGIVDGDADFGKDSDDRPLSGTVSADGKTATVNELADRAIISLSSGEGFSHADGVRLVGWKDGAEKRFALGGDYIVNAAQPEIETFKAIWQTNVTYHLNDEEGKGDWADFSQLPSSTYYYNSNDKTYNQVAYIGGKVSEPAAAPTYRDDEKLFQYWATRSGEEGSYTYTEYDFTQPVTGVLDLYAYWGAPINVTVHAVDATDVQPVEVDTQEDEYNEWKVNNVTVATTETLLPGTGIVTVPGNYEFGFVAVARDLGSVSEAGAATSIKYDGKRKTVCVKYVNSDEFVDLEAGESLWYVFYEKKELGIAYMSMNAQSDLTPVTTAEGAVSIADDLGTFDMAGQITTPLTWAEGYESYAFAIGSQNAENVSMLSVITGTSTSDTDRPALKVKNTWRGFAYTMDDGETWTNCGYDIRLYVIYFASIPTIVNLHEKTVGMQEDMGESFAFNYQIIEVENGTETPVYDYHNAKNDYITLKNGEEWPIVLFKEGNKTQKVTIIQTSEDGFTTAVGNDEINTYSYTPEGDGIGGTVDVTFTNTRTYIPVVAHVALVEEEGIIRRDDKRSSTEADYQFSLGLGQSAELLTVLPATSGERTVGEGADQTTESYNGLFAGDADVYAFGATLYAPEANEGAVVDAGGIGFSRIACLPTSEGSNVYELVLQDDKENRLAGLGDNNVYYLYYPTPVIKYVKAVEAEEDETFNLQAVRGLAKDTETGELIEAEEGKLTYNLESITMNGGREVTQNQRLELPLEGLTISQSGNSFRMPSVLDDGATLAERYLTYSYLLAGNEDVTSITESELSDGAGKTLRLKITNNALQYSYDGTHWESLSIADGKRPTIYAVYTERGYDLLITKTVPMGQSGEDPIFSGKEFTVTITSDKIATKPETEGEEGEIVYIPADAENNKGQLKLTVKDGSMVKLIGLAKGEYTIEESGSENYVLTAKSGAIVGGTMSDIELPEDTLTLDTEKKVELVNTPKVICKIGNKLFYTLNDAVDYAAEMPDRTATIEMLTNYTLPPLDAVEIPVGYHITLATDKDLNGNPIDSAFTIKRDAEMADAPLFDNKGSLTFANIIIDGDSISATAPMIENSGELTVNDSARLIDAVSTGDGGAIHATAGDIYIYGQIENNEALNGGAIYCSGNGNITVSRSSYIAKNKANGGNGGAIYCAGNGEITLSGMGSIEDNEAEDGNGGAIFSQNGTINIRERIQIKGNTAENGGAIYAESGLVAVTAEPESNKPTFEQNYATDNGGAIWISTGTLSVSSGKFQGNGEKNNSYTKKGGAIYVNSGTFTLSNRTITTSDDDETGGDDGAGGGDTAPTTNETVVKSEITGNYALNGAAIFVNTGKATFTGGDVMDNTVNGNASIATGGAVGVGETSARLYFSDTVQITGNFFGAGTNKVPSNVYLDQDTDAVINTSGLTASGNVGIYVPNKEDKDGTEYLYKNRGGVGGVFGVFSDAEASVDGFHNDRWEKLYARRDETARKIFWTAPVSIEVRYLKSFGNGFPNGSNGDIKLGQMDYYPTSEDMAFSAIAEELRDICASMDNGAVYATTLKRDKGINDSDYGPGDYNNYLTKLVWQENMWKVVRRDGSTVPLVDKEEVTVTDEETGAEKTVLVDKDTKLVLYYALPAFVSIENNTNYDLDISSMTVKMPGNNNTSVINKYISSTNGNTGSQIVGCGLVFARDAVIQSDLLPVEMQNNTLKLARGGSINVLIPGGQNRDFSLQGQFVGMSTGETASLRMDGVEQDSVGGNFTLPVSGKTLKTKNNTETYEIIFGGDKNICKIWAPNRFESVDDAKNYFIAQDSVNEALWNAGYSGLLVNDGTKQVLPNWTATGFDTEAAAIDYFKKKYPNANSQELTIPENSNGKYTVYERNSLYETKAAAQDAAKANCTSNYGPDYSGEADVCQVGNEWAVVARREIPFSTMRGAVAFAKENDLQDVTIEMIVDYLMPGSDVVKITDSKIFVTTDNTGAAGYVPYIAIPGIEKITLTTATMGQYVYDGTRASISRGNGNTKDPVITVSVQSKDADEFANVVIRNLNFDGKALTGSCDGGALKTKNCKVDIEDADFKSFISKNGGAIFIAYGEEASNVFSFTDYVNIDSETLKNSKSTKLDLTVRNASFTNCESKTKTNRCGGGAIWMNGKELKLENCKFSNCVASDQGGAVFHRIESQSKNSYTPYPYCTLTKTTVTGTNNTFTSCKANAAGGIESDAHTINIVGSTFTLCEALQRGGGGINIYIHDTADYNDNDTTATFTDCTFIGCTAMRDGGGLNCATKYTTLNNCTFRECKVTGLNNKDSKGGGVYFKNANGVDAKVYGCTFEGCSTTVETFPANTNLQALEGGAIACKAKNLTIGKYTVDGEDIKTVIRRCSAVTNGGAIYTEGNGTTDISDIEIEACTAGYCGGGFYTTTATSVKFTDSIIQNCVANVQSGPANNLWGGGGIYHATSNLLTLVATTVQNNSATTADSYGGGVYVKKLLEIQNSYIRGNELPNADAEHAAGIYIADNSAGEILKIGDADMALDSDYRDNSEVTGNKASGQASNLRLPEKNSVNQNSVRVYCNLGPKANQGKKEGGVIGVVNAKVVGTQFGQSPNSVGGTEGWRPTGLGDQDAVFQSDNSTLRGIIDRSDTSNKKIIWGGPPICKLTDAGGRDLYFGSGDPAIFDRLDSDGNGQRTSPFSLFRGSSMPTLKYADGTVYNASENNNVYYLKMLVETCELNTSINATFGSDITVTFTTAGKTGNDKDYPYEGTPERDGTCRAMLTCVDSQPLLKVSGSNGELKLESIILDGSSHASSVVQVDGGRLILGNKAILQNANNIAENENAGTGGGVYITNGEFQINGGTVRNCVAQNGGGVYTAGGKFIFTEGSITRCTAMADGGGVYVGTGTGEFRMNGGIIGYSSTSTSNRNTAVNGGGVFVADGQTMYMAGGIVRNNNASVQGGGIAVGGGNAKLYFSGYVLVTGNTCDVSVADDKTCNVELHLGNTGIIHTGPESALSSRANIGVYVTGGAAPFTTNGQEGQPFGTFGKTDHASTLYCFVNDRNYLKGGLLAGQSANNVPGEIHWIRIFRLQIENQVKVSENAPGDEDIAENAEFEFTVSLRDDNYQNTSQIKVKDIYEEIKRDGQDGRYGAIQFSDINSVKTETTATFRLAAGDSVAAQNLPAGLIYNVVESADSMFEIVPVETRNGYTGQLTEYKEDPYTARLVFINILPVCKIMDSKGALLYQKHEIITGQNANGEDVKQTIYKPAIFAELTGDSGAFNALKGDFYYSSGDKMKAGEKAEGLQIQMLVSNYTLKESLTVPEGMKLTLTTASVSASKHPYRGTGSTAKITRAYNGDSMLVNEGELTLTDIIIDGAKGSTFYATGAGGIVRVSDGGKLFVTNGATLQDSRTSKNVDGGIVYLTNGASMTVSGGTLSGGNAKNGGAVYAASGASMTFTSGSIEKNLCSAYGAGVYLAEGAVLKLSGNPNFGGTGVSQGMIRNNNGNMQSGTQVLATNGRMNYDKMRQDIYIAGYANNEAVSLLVDGDFADTVKAGSIWVWAEQANHYKAEMQFARIEDNVTVEGSTLLAFRNARPDAETDANKTGSYLHGEGDGKKIKWNSLAVCKLTDGNDILLYQYDDASNMYIPAVYTTVKEGFNAAKGNLYRKNGNEYTGETLKLKLLLDYTLTDEDSNIISDVPNLTFTTAERRKDLDQTTINQMASNGDTFFYSNDSSQIATLSFGNEYGTYSMITIESGSLTLRNITLDGKNIQTSVDGGIVKATSGSLIIEQGATLQKSVTTGNGGAVYMSGGTLEMTGGSITGCSAANGGAVYVASGATMEMKSGTGSTNGSINGNSASTAGAGIYLAYNTAANSGGVLKLSGNPNFGGTGTESADGSNASAAISGPSVATGTATNGNYLTGSLPSNTKNGQVNYSAARQDIFLAGYATTGSAAQSIVISGPLGTTSGSTFTAMVPGSIWVWAEEAEHYKMLKQFAVFESADTKTNMTNDQLTGTLAAFRNAKDDVATECGADYLTGQEGDDINNLKCIYWTGGFDFVFRKINSNGETVTGAVFKLYKANTDGNGFLNGEKVAYARSGDDVTGTSADITAENAVTIKVYNAATETAVNKEVYGSGLVKFEKIPPGTYFLSETVYPAVSEAAGALHYKGAQADLVAETGETLYKVIVHPKGWCDIYNPDSFDSAKKQVWKKDTEQTDSDKVPFTLFGAVTDSNNNKRYTGLTTKGASTTDTVNIYTIMNVNPIKRKVILRKVAKDTYTPLAGARFRIFRADLSEITDGQPTTGEGASVTKKGYYESLASGVYFIGQLPEGKYYLVETGVPAGAETDDNLGKVFTLEIKDGMERLLETTVTISTTETTSVKLVDSLRTWVASQPAAAAPVTPPDGGGDTTG